MEGFRIFGPLSCTPSHQPHQVAKNKQTLAVLELCYVLMSFGAFSNVRSVINITCSLVALLNGVTDMVRPGEKVRPC